MDLWKTVKSELSHEKFSVYEDACKILNPKSRLLNNEDCDDIHQFTLQVPYAMGMTSWTYLLDPHNPDFPPDILLSPEDADFDINLDELRALSEWRACDASKLLALLSHELMDQYTRHMRRKLARWQRVKFELDTLLNDARLKGVEARVDTTEDGSFVKATFLIKLALDEPSLKLLPVEMKPANPGQDQALLSVTFVNSSGTSTYSHLYLSPRLQLALDQSGGFSLPPLPVEGCLMDYIPNVTNLIQAKLGISNDGVEHRRSYIMELVSKHGQSLIEYDGETFLSASVLFDYHDFFFLLEVRLSALFPKQQPRLCFRSVYHVSEQTNIPFSASVEDYPYSPRWSAQEHITRLTAYLLENAPKFQRLSCQKGVWT